MPERDSFVLKDDRQPASASVLLVLERGVDIAPNKVKGIEELMLKSVMGLRKENLSIVDNMILNNLQTGEMNIMQFELQRQVYERLKAINQC